MIQVDDLSRSLIAFKQISTLVIVVELSQSSWLAAGVVPGIARHRSRARVGAGLASVRLAVWHRPTGWPQWRKYRSTGWPHCVWA
jgi:hypothetical protein